LISLWNSETAGMISLWNWDIGTFLFSYLKLLKKIKRGKRKKGKIKSKGKFEIRE